MPWTQRIFNLAMFPSLRRLERDIKSGFRGPGREGMCTESRAPPRACQRTGGIPPMRTLLFPRLPILLFIMGCASASALQEESRLSPLRAEFQSYVDRHQTAGTVTLVAHKGKVISLEAVGWQDLEAKLPMKTDTIFQIASMTKPITAIAILMLEEEGKLSIADPVEKHLPEFRGQQIIQKKEGSTITLGKPVRPITLTDLLTHTSGLRGGSPPGFGDLYSKRNR